MIQHQQFGHKGVVHPTVSMIVPLKVMVKKCQDM